MKTELLTHGYRFFEANKVCCPECGTGVWLNVQGEGQAEFFVNKSGVDAVTGEKSATYHFTCNMCFAKFEATFAERGFGDS
jgi:hypothetical protein